MTDMIDEEPGITRKLTTIFHADICGYSRLMGQDEIGTLQRLKDYKQAVSSFVSRHQGRIINWTGDGLLAEFASVVEAVECGVEIQRELMARNGLLEQDRRMEFRVGINLGDVMVDNDELFGEGVNIAARLQSIAPVGGVLISGTAFDQVRNKLSIEFDFMGRQSVKNIADQIPAYAVVLDPNQRPSAQRITRPHEGLDDQISTMRGPLANSAVAKHSIDVFPGPYAGFWRRAVALTVDWTMVAVACMILGDLTDSTSVMGIQPIIYLLYLSAFESGPWQASVGKKIMGIKVIDITGENLNFPRALGRNMSKILSVLTLFFGFAMTAWNPRKQALHDTVSETLLVDEDALAEKEGRRPELWSS